MSPPIDTTPKRSTTRMANLTPNTKFTIGISAACVFCLSAAGAVYKATNILNSIDQRLATVETGVNNGYKLADACEQALRMAIENPGFKVPDPRDPTRIIEVRRTVP